MFFKIFDLILRKNFVIPKNLAFFEIFMHKFGHFFVYYFELFWLLGTILCTILAFLRNYLGHYFGDFKRLEILSLLIIKAIMKKLLLAASNELDEDDVELDDVNNN